jgi:hypothetical protein
MTVAGVTQVLLSCHFRSAKLPFHQLLSLTKDGGRNESLATPRGSSRIPLSTFNDGISLA